MTDTKPCGCVVYCVGAHRLPENRHCVMAEPLPVATPSLPAAKIDRELEQMPEPAA